MTGMPVSALRTMAPVLQRSICNIYLKSTTGFLRGICRKRVDMVLACIMPKRLYRGMAAQLK